MWFSKYGPWDLGQFQGCFREPMRSNYFVNNPKITFAMCVCVYVYVHYADICSDVTKVIVVKLLVPQNELK